MTAADTLVRRYFELAPSQDRESYFAQFAADAVVEDEGRSRRGIQDIRRWRTEVPSVEYTVLGVESSPAGHDAKVDIAGDFPGSPVVLGFHFEFSSDNRITHLVIRP